MKRLLTALLFTPAGFIFAQPAQPLATMTPATPKAGETISVTYNTDAPSALLRNAAEIQCQTMVGRPEVEPLLIETMLKKEGNHWQGAFKLDVPNASYLVVRFVSGDKIDDNSGNVWDALVYGNDNKPVKDAHRTRGGLLLQGRWMSYRHAVDIPEAKSEFLKELELYPDNLATQFQLWDLALKENATAAAKDDVKKQLAAFYAGHSSDEGLLSDVVHWYERLGDTTRADEIRTSRITRNPGGKFARSIRSGDIWKEKDHAKRAVLIEKILKDFPDLEKRRREGLLSDEVYALTQAKQYDRAREVISRLEKPDGSMYNEIAWALIEKGDQLEKAVAWSRTGIDLMRNTDLASKPTYQSIGRWKENNEYNLGMYLDTYGFGLLQLGRNDEAAKTFTEAFHLMKGSDPDVNTRCMESLIKTSGYQQAIDVGVECITKGKDSPKLLDYLKEAYAKKEGSTSGYDALVAEKQKKFDDMVAEAGKAKSEEIRKKIVESRTSKPSVDFTLKDLNGTPVTLSSLKGKVVVVDFWATWCGPCKASFPYLQKVYEKYRSNPDVVFLALDTWEHDDDHTAKLANAKKFMAENKYTFPVLIDEKLVDKYGVEGIPTKFIIDKKGSIAFTSIGFNGPEMVEELTQQIELLLAESIGALK